MMFLTRMDLDITADGPLREFRKLPDLSKEPRGIYPGSDYSPRTFLTISSAMFVGTSAYESNSIEYDA